MAADPTPTALLAEKRRQMLDRLDTRHAELFTRIDELNERILATLASYSAQMQAAGLDSEAA